MHLNVFLENLQKEEGKKTPIFTLKRLTLDIAVLDFTMEKRCKSWAQDSYSGSISI